MRVAVPDTAEEVVHQLLLTPEGRRDPYPHYHRLRELDPVHHAEALGVWLLTRYEDCAAAMRDPRLGKDYPRQMEARFGPDWRRHSALVRAEHSLLNEDGAAHGRLRKLVVKGFTRRRIDALRPRIEAILDSLLEPFGDAGGGDLLDALAFPMPVTVIGELLGVPEDERAQFRHLVVDLTGAFEMRPTEAQMTAADGASDAIRAYFDDLIERKRRRPDDRLLSALMHVEDGADRLSHDELATMGTLLFIAGFETTTNLIGNALYGLLRQPEQIEILRQEPERLATVPDELLRFDGTAQMTVRDALDDIEIGGRLIPAGSVVYNVVGAANHDPAEFRDPDRIDVRRERFRPLALGGGAHFCLGAALAKAETEITFRRLLESFDSIEIVREPQFRDRLTLRGLTALELEVKRGAQQRLRAEAPPAEPAPPPGPPSSRTAAPAPGAVRPRSGTGDDRAWRNALRREVESGASGAWVRPDRLAATIVLLARTELFAACTPEQIAELAATAYPLAFEDGEALCVEGAESLECYVIQEGEADVAIEGEHVRVVGENAVVGERGVLEDSARSATVTARGHVLTWALSRDRLLALVRTHPELHERMLAHVRERYGD